MASSSSSSFASNSQPPQWLYDVFLSFRGEDTRKTFTGHLYEGLRNRGIHAFHDDKRLEHGVSISEELCKAIKGSQGALIIFSKNYASSTWCLDELVKIMECNKINQLGQTLVIPIFYHVDPSTVRYQKDIFAEAFYLHESRFKVNDDVEGMQKVQRWRTALTSAADLKGYHIGQGVESDYIQEIVDEISSKLCKNDISYLSNVVGITAHLEKIKTLLEIEIRDVRIMGIWGMGGVGKTITARAIFDTLSHRFEAACFLADIKENDIKKLHFLQNTLLSELLRKEKNYVNNNYDGKKVIQSRLHSKKVLIVLDDIDHRDHLDFLAGDHGWFGNGSRIIATTRDRHLMGKNDLVYEVTTLIDGEALRLFNQYAFREEVPDESFENLTSEVVSHAKGLPLALKVWGSFLYNRDINEWRSAIADMKKNSNSEIVDKLKISYNRLEPTLQKMFLDLACFLRGEKRGEIKVILETCDFEVDIGLRVLIDRALVFISADKDTIEMHDLIQEMGKSVVNMQREPGERSRLWLPEDIKKVLKNNTGTKAVEAIWLPIIDDDLYFSNEAKKKYLYFSNEAFINMRSLRILQLTGGRTQDGSVECLPNSLRLLVWSHYPWESLPETFEPKKLVNLQLIFSELRFLWTGIKDLRYLRVVNLKYSGSLKRTPDFTGMPNLEYLYMGSCCFLEEVSPSLGCCRKLIQLNLYGCLKLKRLPEEIGDLENLEELNAEWTEISQPPSSIVRLNKLKYLSFRQPSYSKAQFVFPPVGKGLRSLKVLRLTSRNLIDGGLPEDIGCLSSLKKLYLEDNDFEHLPRSIAQLSALRVLNLSGCYNLKELPELPPELGVLSASSDVILKDIKSLVSKKKLLVLNLIIDDAQVDNDSIYNYLARAQHQNFFSKQQDISTSDSLSQRVFSIPTEKIPSWFRYQGENTSVSVDLPKNWYIHDNFLGFAVCYKGISVETVVHLIPLCDDDEMSWMTQKLTLHKYSEYDFAHLVIFFFLPITGLWDTSKANGKIPNDYGHIRIYFSGEVKKYGLRLLYKDKLEGESLLHMKENNDEPAKHCIGIRRSISI